MKDAQSELLQLFDDQPIRAAWDNENDEWYFSIVDVVGVRTERFATKIDAFHLEVL